MDEALKQWRKDGKHLPECLRDFHDAKDLFAAMHQLTAWSDATIGGDITSIEGQCYVIDCFLWFMARHGYTLQRSRSAQNFESLPDNVAAMRQIRMDAFSKALGMHKETAPADPAPALP